MMPDPYANGAEDYADSLNAVRCPVCGKPAKFVEDNEDMAWYCEECHVAIETDVEVED
jgi:ribosomal protein L37AE/L43A